MIPNDPPQIAAILTSLFMVSLAATEDFIQSVMNKEKEKSRQLKFYSQLSFQERGRKIGNCFLDRFEWPLWISRQRAMFYLSHANFLPHLSQLPAILHLSHHLPCHVLQPDRGGPPSLLHPTLHHSSLDPVSLLVLFHFFKGSENN